MSICDDWREKRRDGYCRDCLFYRDTPVTPEGKMRTFETGATRDTEGGKEDYEGFLSPMVLKRFAEYMSKHRIQADGTVRASDNWQRGIPRDVYIKSAWRHFMDVWLEHRGQKSRDGLEDALCGLMFNVMGYLFQVLREGKRSEIA